MNSDWSPRLKLVYAVLCLVLFTAVMTLIGKYVATPFAEWGSEAMSSWPLWLQIGALLMIFPLWYLAWKNAKRSQRANMRRPY